MSKSIQIPHPLLYMEILLSRNTNLATKNNDTTHKLSCKIITGTKKKLSDLVGVLRCVQQRARSQALAKFCVADIGNFGAHPVEHTSGVSRWIA